MSAIADALDHTEADVKRALAYWEEAGLLERERTRTVRSPARARKRKRRRPGMWRSPRRRQLRPYRAPFREQEFTALYMRSSSICGKTFTQIECEKFAFFYDGLRCPGIFWSIWRSTAPEAAIPASGILKVALNWYQMGIHTGRRPGTAPCYSRDTSAVMKAFGITGRSPATAETEFMKRWFKEFGFDCKLVTEACGRTIKATGTASFPYADKILTGWKEAGVRPWGTWRSWTGGGRRRKDRTGGSRETAEATGRKPSGSNRFKNFEERTYNYKDYMGRYEKETAEGRKNGWH